MVSIDLEAGALRVELTRGEKLAALRRADVVIPWAQIRSVEAVADPIRLVHGLRAPGLGIPGRTKIGTWRSKGRKTFAVTHKGLTRIADHPAGQHVRRDPAVRRGFGCTVRRTSHRD